ncbi:HpcH/HpaI aldolase/citrate lyase family protein [Limoniibacter endophyticus]|uniref:Citryl-CoA lyase n=1 Tax=Limoniibacter endophyticus TaxID=1565040 RepID=A0A8J3GHE8_9HYPH|nr:CoA ester lyase [Limoniibacter endophyticus]GHC74298.1 citryl-CoA lyase [Limoniibacter endophyticus]
MAHRSALYVPAANRRALAKTLDLQADIVIADLEDAVGPEEKDNARQNLRHHFQMLKGSAKPVIRINMTSSEWFADDLALCLELQPRAILLPKVNSPADIRDLDQFLDDADCDPELKIWAMIETPRGILNITAIAELGLTPARRLEAFVVGTNDLAKETGVALTPFREHMHPWLMQIVLAARAAGLIALDGVSNDFRDLDALEEQCRQSVNMGFDGRTIIHPAQVDTANRVFSPSKDEVASARAIVDAFEREENRNKGVIALNGKMVERLHRDMALRLLARATQTTNGES